MVVRKYKIALLVFAVTFLSVYSFADDAHESGSQFRILSWNISESAYDWARNEFVDLLNWADPDIVLLDEVHPSEDITETEKAIKALLPDNPEEWSIDIGASGGRQRSVIATRGRLEPIPEFSSIIPYPDEARQYLMERMTEDELRYSMYAIDGGIPVNAAIVVDDNRRLLVVSADLQCCGDDQSSWQEYRRRVEAQEIRKLIRKIIGRTSVDGIVVAGDVNLVNGPMPLVLLGGPYPENGAGLSTAEVYHPNGTDSWTWDGRGTPFPSGTLDFQLYDSQRLALRSGLILDSENLPQEILDKHGLSKDTSRRTGRHRPIVIEYGWK